MFWTIHMEGSPCTLNTPAVAVGNSIFSFGQACCDRSSQNLVVRMFNTTNYRWSFMETKAEEGERIPDERYGHTAVAYMSKVYVWGGSTQDENYFFRKLCCFDTTTNTWSFPEVSGSIPRGRVNHFACLVGNLMYIIGGFEQFRPNICKEIYALDLESMTWDIVKTREKFPKLNMKCCFAVMGNRIYFFTGKLHWNEITYLDTVSCKWSTTFATGEVLSLRRWAQTFVFGRHIYLFGGRDEIYYLDYNDIQRYTPETNEWKAVKPLGLAPVPRYRHSCVRVGARVFVFGGVTRYNKFSVKDTQAIISTNNIECCMDVNVLDLCPSLRTLCFEAIYRNNIDVSMLPDILQSEFNTVTRKFCLFNC